MRLHQLTKIVDRKAKRVGRGPSSGKGHMSGRGSKGQRQRSKIRVGFEGGQVRLSQRFPIIRGKGFHSIQVKPIPISLGRLDQVFQAGEEVSMQTLIEKKIILDKVKRVKILSRGKLTKKLNISPDLPISAKAAEKVSAVSSAKNS
jgi:large subunit ribosomal protein L15